MNKDELAETWLLAGSEGGQMTAEEIVERIMTQHWDMAACRCWVCENGRNAGLGPRERFLTREFEEVRVDSKKEATK